MRLFGIAFTAALIASPVLGSNFFQQSNADKIKKNLNSIQYEVFDSAGLVKDSVLESFDKESLQAWLEAHGVTDASKQTIEEAKKHKDWLIEDIKDYASKSDDFSRALLSKGKDFYNQKAKETGDFVWSQWSESKLKEFLDARGVNVPQGSTRDQLVALVSRAKYKSPFNSNGPSGKYWFDTLSREDLAKRLKEAGQSAEGTRRELADRLYKSYNEAYAQGKAQGGEAANSLKKTLGEWKDATVNTFNSWSIDDLKDYLSDYETDVTGTKDRLVEKAKENYYYFVHGQAPPKTLMEKLQFRLRRTFTSVQQYFVKLIGLQAFVRSDL